MKAYSPGFYTSANKGDAALVDVYIKWLEVEFGVDEIALSSFTPERDASYFGIEVLPMITSPYRGVHRAMEAVVRRLPKYRPLLTQLRLVYIRVLLGLIGMWSVVHRRTPRVAALVAPSILRRHCDAIESSGLVVAVPGGYLNALDYTDDWWLFHLPPLKLAASLGKPLMLAPCSIGPFHPAHEPLARDLLGKCDVIMMREDASVRIADDLGIPAVKVIPAPDLGFKFAALGDPVDLPFAVRQVTEAHQGQELLGISVRRHDFPGSPHPAQSMSDYLSTVAEVASTIQAKYGCHILIIPQTLEDFAVGESLSKLLADRGAEASHLAGDYSPVELCSIYSHLRLLIGTRMHANILAMSVGTPVAAIGYELKTIGILQRMGASHWGLPIEDLDGGRLMGLAMRQWQFAPQLSAEAAQMAEVQASEWGVATMRARRMLGV